MPDDTQLLAKLDELRKLDSRLQAYGARSHRYKLERPLTEEEVASFEARHNITLPEEFRDFLLQVGSSGAGPSCDGLWLLEKFPESRGELSRPFLFDSLWCPRCSQEASDEIRLRTGADQLTQGSLSIGSYGCSLIVRLVITGPMRGQMCVDDFGSDNGIWPDGELCACCFECEEDYELSKAEFRRFTFLDWYETWIESAKREAIEASIDSK